MPSSSLNTLEQEARNPAPKKDAPYQAANNAGQKVREFLNHTSHDVSDAATRVKAQIRQSPIAASAIAVTIGFALGSFFNRR